MFNLYNKIWILVSSTGKVFDNLIKDLGFNPRLYKKLIVS